MGALGEFDLAAGTYIYTGSARRNPAARVARHLAREKRLRWHVDWLLAHPAARVTEVRWFTGAECAVNRATPGELPVPGFGASDCRAGCGAHLKRGLGRGE